MNEDKLRHLIQQTTKDLNDALLNLSIAQEALGKAQKGRKGADPKDDLARAASRLKEARENVVDLLTLWTRLREALRIGV